MSLLRPCQTSKRFVCDRRFKPYQQEHWKAVAYLIEEFDASEGIEIRSELNLCLKDWGIRTESHLYCINSLPARPRHELPRKFEPFSNRGEIGDLESRISEQVFKDPEHGCRLALPLVPIV